MSHFTVMVVGENVEEQLAPFQENNMGDCPEDFLKFNDTEDGDRKQYEEGTVEKIVMPNGELKNPWEDCFREPDTISSVLGEIPGAKVIGGKRNIPADLERRQVPFKELYSTFEEFMEEWHGRERRDPKTGRYGYWENPNAKWDWYQIGGRWTGHFKLLPLGSVPVGPETLKSLGFSPGELSYLRRLANTNLSKLEEVVAKFLGKEEEVMAAVRGTIEKYPPHAVGDPGVFGHKARRGYADSCLKKYIDFETMRRQAEEKAGRLYDRVHKAIDGLPPSRSWDQIREEYCPDNKMERIDEARKVYHDQPRVDALRTVKGLGWLDGPEEFDVPRERYLKAARDGAISTFAILKDGEWHERGQMGWFGCAANEKDEETWNSMFSNLLDELPDDTLLTVVDCHI